LFRYHLLCDSCNWEFAGFAVPGTVASRPAKSSRKRQSGRVAQENPADEKERTGINDESEKQLSVASPADGPRD
jgi:hypothetical protein